MFTSQVPTYLIDLAKDQPDRWADVISHEASVAGRLVADACEEFQRVPEALRWLFAKLYRWTGGLYQEEIQAWADALKVSAGTATMLNCAYELSHLRWPQIFGCTAGVRWIEGLGMVHVRSLDWPLASMGAATRLFRFRRGTREFISVGVPGHVAVLSGMLPGAYSVTINWAPPGAFPSFEFGPAFLLRDVLEACDSYDDAVQRLTRTHLSTSVFFTVCGIEKDQACVIERTQRAAVIRALAGPVLVQANHHVAERFRGNNDEIREVPVGEKEFSLEGSSSRADALQKALTEMLPPYSLESAAKTLESGSVLNKFTCQQIVFCPRAKDVLVCRYVGV